MRSVINDILRLICRSRDVITQSWDCMAQADVILGNAQLGVRVRPKPSDVADRDREQPAADQQTPCMRCGRTLDLLTHFPRRAGNPAYRIVGCAVCGFIKWLPEQIIW